MKKKKAAIVQSCYIPWKGTFDLINSVDDFVLFDDVQFTKRDWRNRNRIKTPGGVEWLTIPVDTKGRYDQTIRETMISDPAWARDHWNTLRHVYAAAPFFKKLKPLFENLYLSQSEKSLSLVNRAFLEAINGLLGIQTRLSWSWEYPVVQGRNERLIAICKALGASIYLSGPKARGYLDEALFNQEGIGVEWMSYDGYPEYPQLYPPFEHGVTVLDLLFHAGDDARSYLLSTGKALCD